MWNTLSVLCRPSSVQYPVVELPVYLCSYVSAMVPVKTMKEYEVMQDVVILFCETVGRLVPYIATRGHMVRGHTTWSALTMS